MSKIEYALIAGQGRSGTNWLLDLLDISPLTRCRNEPDKLPDCALSKLPPPTVCQNFDDTFGKQWDEAIQATALRMGERDRIGTSPKVYLSETARQILGEKVLAKKQARKFISLLIPELGNSEWTVPQWYVDKSKFQEAFPIFKLNQIPAWANWTVENRPNALVIHIVRHPGGFLNSWKSRYLKKNKLEDVKEANEKRLKEIAKVDTEWAKKFGDIDAMTVEESELWYWCYTNEMIYCGGQGRPNYLSIIYENLVAEPLSITQLLYDKCNLPLTEEIKKVILENSSSSKEIAETWYKKLLPEERELVERFQSNNIMGQWWQESSTKVK
ncbi:MAG: hypothetical protein N5P05_000394 [Chroococcopsis gigantea SAG 12.99]|jgi:hypothetical protein|nr:hypothetical protein [Chroococcopsis gigantea SAG 12.99]